MKYVGNIVPSNKIREVIFILKTFFVYNNKYVRKRNNDSDFFYHNIKENVDRNNVMIKMWERPIKCHGNFIINVVIKRTEYLNIGLLYMVRMQLKLKYKQHWRGKVCT